MNTPSFEGEEERRRVFLAASVKRFARPTERIAEDKRAIDPPLSIRRRGPLFEAT